MTSYLVQWSINVDADSPTEAAEVARAISHDPHSLATVWDVADDEGGDTEYIDLEESEGALTALAKSIEHLLKVRDAERDDDASTEDLLDALALVEEDYTILTSLR